MKRTQGHKNAWNRAFTCELLGTRMDELQRQNVWRRGRGGWSPKKWVPMLRSARDVIQCDKSKVSRLWRPFILQSMWNTQYHQLYTHWQAHSTDTDKLGLSIALSIIRRPLLSHVHNITMTYIHTYIHTYIQLIQSYHNIQRCYMSVGRQHGI